MSETTKHTPGPWQVVGDCVYTVKKWRNGVHQHIATVSKVGASINDYEANAALIASAPALAARVEVLTELADAADSLLRAIQQTFLINGYEYPLGLTASIADVRAVLDDAKAALGASSGAGSVGNE